MPYCVNCGKQLVDGAKFCFDCGAPVDGTADNTKRKTVYDGEIHKCPNCGEILNSFVSICPSCGFELGGKHVSAALKEFIDRINECDILIASSSATKTGWSSWSKSKRFWWVILNLIFLCIPLVIYLVLPLVFINSTPKLTSEEKQMVSLIENFPFPNDRESILAALIYTKEKIDFISKEKIDRKSAFWIRMWCAKAEQLKQKADMLFPNDNIVKQSYAEILVDNETVKKRIRIKAIVGFVLLAIVIVFVIIRYDVLNNTGITDSKDYSATFEWQSNGLFAELPQPSTNNGKIVMETERQVSIELYNIKTADFEAYVKLCREVGFTVDVTKTDMVFYANDEEGHKLSIFYYNNKDLMSINVNSYDIENEAKENSNNNAETSTTPINVKNFTFNLPRYWEEEGSKNEYLQYYAEKGNRLVMMSIAYPEESDDTYDVSFDGLYSDNENMIRMISSMFTEGDVIDHEVFETDYGIKGILYRYSCKQNINWLTSIDANGYLFCFPSEKDRRWFYVYYIQTNNVTDKKYKDDYMTLISTIREKP